MNRFQNNNTAKKAPVKAPAKAPATKPAPKTNLTKARPVNAKKPEKTLDEVLRHAISGRFPKL